MTLKEAVDFYKKNHTGDVFYQNFSKWVKENNIEIPKEGEPHPTEWKLDITEEMIQNVEYDGLRAGRIELWRNSLEDGGYAFSESHIVVPNELYELIDKFISNAN